MKHFDKTQNSLQVEVILQMRYFWWKTVFEHFPVTRQNISVLVNK